MDLLNIRFQPWTETVSHLRIDKSMMPDEKVSELYVQSVWSLNDPINYLAQIICVPSPSTDVKLLKRGNISSLSDD